MVAKAFFALSILWALAALAAQILAARSSRIEDYSTPAGSPRRGLLYGFTVAMMPANKETIRRHPINFVGGVLMHLGVLLALLVAILLLIWPAGGGQVLQAGFPPMVLGLGAAGFLLLRRLFSGELRAVSVPDDFLAVAATCGLLAMGSALGAGAVGQTPFLIYAGLLLVYLPLGKLRHSAFFFFARADHTWRLGYRGVYPPAGPRFSSARHVAASPGCRAAAYGCRAAGERAAFRKETGQAKAAEER